MQELKTSLLPVPSSVPGCGGIHRQRGAALLLKCTIILTCQWLQGASLPLPGSTGWDIWG